MTGMEQAKPRRRWLRISLGGLMLAITVLCLLLGWQADRVARQRHAVEMIERLGGYVTYEPRWSESPGWLREKLGEDWFSTVASVALDQSSKPLSEGDCRQLANLTHLKRLSLRSRVTDEQLRDIARLTTLETLSCDGRQISDQGLKTLSRLRNLHELEISNSGERDTPFSKSGLQHLVALDKLRSLALGDANVSDADLDVLAPLSQIEEFSIDFPEGTLAALEWLHKWPRCRVLVLSGVDVTDDGWEVLASCTALGGLWFTKAKLSEEGLSKLSKCQLFALGLQETRVSPDAIVQLKHLQFLNLWYNEVNLATIESLNRLPQLEHLSFRGPTLRDDVLARLPVLPGLVSLTLSETNIGDDGLAGINQLPQLRYLYLDKTNVTDSGLARLPSGLRRLYLTGTKVTEAAAERFRQATGAEVITDASPEQP